MSFTNDPANNPIDRVRLMVGDTSPPPFEYLPDTTYTFLLTKYSNNEVSAAKEAAMYILAGLTRSARERTGEIEVYGSEYYKNYKDYLKDIINGVLNPLSAIEAYFGGVSREDYNANLEDTDAIKPLERQEASLAKAPYIPDEYFYLP